MNTSEKGNDKFFSIKEDINDIKKIITNYNKLCEDNDYLAFINTSGSFFNKNILDEHRKINSILNCIKKDIEECSKEKDSL